MGPTSEDSRGKTLAALWRDQINPTPRSFSKRSSEVLKQLCGSDVDKTSARTSGRLRTNHSTSTPCRRRGSWNICSTLSHRLKIGGGIPNVEGSVHTLSGSQLLNAISTFCGSGVIDLLRIILQCVSRPMSVGIGQAQAHEYGCVQHLAGLGYSRPNSTKPLCKSCHVFCFYIADRIPPACLCRKTPFENFLSTPLAPGTPRKSERTSTLVHAGQRWPH
jgi:hypothetical protein